jgi:two-component system, LuxR family, response regulator FixJ
LARGIVHLVDDDDAVRESIRMLLEIVEYEVRVYPLAQALLEDLPGPPGCVLTDLNMPDMDGFELRRRLREAGCALPVLLMTGMGDPGIHERARFEGVTEVLDKPFKMAALVSAIERAFDEP